MVFQYIPWRGNETDFFSTKLSLQWGNIISDTNLAINEDITEELLLENNPGWGKHESIDFKLTQRQVKEYLVTKFLDCWGAIWINEYSR